MFSIHGSFEVLLKTHNHSLILNQICVQILKVSPPPTTARNKLLKINGTTWNLMANYAICNVTVTMQPSSFPNLLKEHSGHIFGPDMFQYSWERESYQVDPTDSALISPNSVSTVCLQGCSDLPWASGTRCYTWSIGRMCPVQGSLRWTYCWKSRGQAASHWSRCQIRCCLWWKTLKTKQREETLSLCHSIMKLFMDKNI